MLQLSASDSISQKIKVFFIHLFFSAAFILLVFLIIRFVWYPFPLLEATGGWGIFLMVMVADIMIGPALTGFVYEKNKRSLKNDILIIVAIQFAAMVCGVKTLYDGRPVYIAALGHRFDLIQANEFNDDVKLPIFGPVVTGTRRAENREARNKMLINSLAGKDYGHFQEYHVSLDQMKSVLLSESKPISLLIKYNSGREHEIRDWLKNNNIDEDNAVFQGLKARSEDMAVILDARNAQLIGVARFNPWENNE